MTIVEIVNRLEDLFDSFNLDSIRPMNYGEFLDMDERDRGKMDAYVSISGTLGQLIDDIKDDEETK